VQIVSQKISAEASTVSVIDSKEAAPWPFVRVDVCSRFWWQQIGDDGDSVLIVISDEALVCVGSVRSDDACAFIGSFGRFVTRNYDFMSWLNSEALTSVALWLCLLHIDIWAFNVFIDVGFAPRPGDYLLFLTLCFGTIFLFCGWPLTYSSIIGL
jgi:hypothetical protein